MTTDYRIGWKVIGYTDVSGYISSTYYEYIVLATSTKTDIQVDIDDIASDLNGKADVDLTNTISSASSSFKSKVFEWGMPDYSSAVDYVSSWGTDVTATANGFVYICSSTTNSGGTHLVINGVDFIVSGLAASSPAVNSGMMLPVKKDDVFRGRGGNGANRQLVSYPAVGA